MGDTSRNTDGAGVIGFANTDLTAFLWLEIEAVGRWPKLFRFVATPWGIDFLWFNA
jgi:hypothetical protein